MLLCQTTDMEVRAVLTEGNGMDKYEETLRKSENLGAEAGKTAAAWVIDGNSSMERILEIKKVIDNCELEMPNPLSGEWADDYGMKDLLDDLDWETDVNEEQNEICQAFETGFAQGYEAELVRMCSYHLDGETARSH